MNETEILTKDVGSILVGKQTVKEGIIDEIGGLKDAMKKLYELVDRKVISRFVPMIKEMSNCMSGSMSNCMSGCVSRCISSHN